MPTFRIERRPLKYPKQPIHSLAWAGDSLIDWAGGGRQWLADGSEQAAGRSYSYAFDSALVSPSGQYIVIHAERHTKGLVLNHEGTILREINRSFYHAENYAYPIALGRLPDGREVIAHCPEDYCRIEIDTLAEGVRLTRRDNQPQDVFHSRLSFSPDGRHLLSAGWVWHPWECAHVFDVVRSLAEPAELDKGSTPPANDEVLAASWLDAGRIILTTGVGNTYDCDDGSDSPDTDLPAGHTGVWLVQEEKWQSQHADWNPRRSLFPCAGGVVYADDCLHWWTPDGGARIDWPELRARQTPEDHPRTGIVHDRPLIAVHPTQPCFAVATETDIAIVHLD